MRTNDTVRVIDNLSVGTRDELASVGTFVETGADGVDRARADEASRIELTVGDIRDAKLAQQVVAGVDVVVHLAANTGIGLSISDPRLDCETNIIGTINYLEACRHAGIAKFVFASSGASIGECEPPIHEERVAHPISPYGASKLAGEAYSLAYKGSFGIETVALRFGNCYGPLSSHKNSVVAKFIREAMAGQGWEIYGDGRQTRDFIFVEDIAQAIFLAAMTEAIGGQVFQIASNSETTVLQLAETLQSVLQAYGVSTRGIRHGAARVGDVKRNYSDTSKARRMLGWKAQTGLEQGLDRTVKWFLSLAS